MDQNKLVLGIELGSTRIKSVLLDQNHNIVAQGFYEWENEYKNGIWTYPLHKIHEGVKECYRSLKADYFSKHKEKLTTLGCIGISGMMHGYLAFDEDGELLVDFRTWRNTITGEAAGILSKKFYFNVPQRWSIAHLFQAMLNKEEHLSRLSYITTIAGYIHYLLTGNNVVGIGEASGIFPIDSKTLDYDAKMLEEMEKLNTCNFKIKDVLPKILLAGQKAGVLSQMGALFLDEEGDLKPGILFCPPEGDAGTGMVATNSVRLNTGNISAGTSDFAMLVTDKKMNVHREIDMVTTPSGLPVAMVHCNNCTNEINAWVNLFDEAIRLCGCSIDKGELFKRLFNISKEGEKDAGGNLSFNYLSGEGVTDLDEGRPLFIRTPDARFNLANFMKMNIMSAFATLKLGLDILTKEEKVKIEKIYAHGGIFKTPGVAQTILSAAIDAPVSIMESANEGGPYGMALLADYCLNFSHMTLEDYLDREIFSKVKTSRIMADQSEVDGFNSYIEKYARCLEVEKKAIESLTVK